MRKKSRSRTSCLKRMKICERDEDYTSPRVKDCCTCRKHVLERELYVQKGGTCWRVVRAGGFNVQVGCTGEGCTCGWVLRAGGLYVQLGSTYRWVVRTRVLRAGGLYVRVDSTCRRIIRVGGGVISA